MADEILPCCDKWLDESEGFVGSTDIVQLSHESLSEDFEITTGPGKWSEDTISISDAAIEDSIGEWEITIVIDDVGLNFKDCLGGQIVAYDVKSQSIKCQDLKGGGMYTLSGIFLIVVITIIVSKWIVPLVNWKSIIKAFFYLIYRPFKREKKIIEDEWTEITQQGE